MTIDEIERDLFDVVLQLAKANGDEEKIFLAIEDLRAVTARVTEYAKPIYERVLSEAKDLFEEQIAQDAAEGPRLQVVPK